MPNLKRLILTGNKVSNLKEIDSLGSLSKLEMLSLIDNPVSKNPHYRLYVVHRIPSLRVLDYRKVKDAERREAEKIFSGKEGGELVEECEIEAEEPEQVERPTPEQLAALRSAIANAKSLEEVARLEDALRRGQIPDEIKQAGVQDSMEEG